MWVRMFWLMIIGMALWPASAMATQGHGGPEGLYVHQFSHLFFAFNMVMLIYWLRIRRLIMQQGWRYIQYAALLFFFWNLDTLVVHGIEEQLPVLEISRSDRWNLMLNAAPGFQWMIPIYYAVKLDHLLCVPAMLLLYMGLRRLLRHSNSKPPTIANG